MAKIKLYKIMLLSFKLIKKCLQPITDIQILNVNVTLEATK
jgi:hypothetical protein